MTMRLPQFELYEEGGQARRSSKSVTSMIVEGYGRRRYKRDYIKHLVCAQTECDETILHLEFLVETGSMPDLEENRSLRQEYELLSKRINKYLQWVENNYKPRPSAPN